MKEEVVSGLDTIDKEPPRCIQIEEGYGFKLILFDNGQVFHTGYGSHGQQGTGYDGSLVWQYRLLDLKMYLLLN